MWSLKSNPLKMRHGLQFVQEVVSYQNSTNRRCRRDIYIHFKRLHPHIDIPPVSAFVSPFICLHPLWRHQSLPGFSSLGRFDPKPTALSLCFSVRLSKHRSEARENSMSLTAASTRRPALRGPTGRENTLLSVWECVWRSVFNLWHLMSHTHRKSNIFY